MRYHLTPLPDYFKIHAHYRADNPHREQRLGQWFYNKYDQSGESFPELFYQENQERCLEIIWREYYVFSA